MSFFDNNIIPPILPVPKIKPYVPPVIKCEPTRSGLYVARLESLRFEYGTYPPQEYIAVGVQALEQIFKTKLPIAYNPLEHRGTRMYQRNKAYEGIKKRVKQCFAYAEQEVTHEKLYGVLGIIHYDAKKNCISCEDTMALLAEYKLSDEYKNIILNNGRIEDVRENMFD